MMFSISWRWSVENVGAEGVAAAGLCTGAGCADGVAAGEVGAGGVCAAASGDSSIVAAIAIAMRRFEIMSVVLFKFNFLCLAGWFSGSY